MTSLTARLSSLIDILFGRDRRLRELRRAAESLAEGNLDTRVPVEGHDELGALARVLNSMAERLGTRVQELHAERDLSHAVIAR